MKRAWRTAAGVLGVGLWLAGVGCGPDAKDQQIQALQERKNQLESELASSEAQRNRAMNEKDQALRRLLDLQAQLDDAKRQQGGVTEREGWTYAGPFAWTDIPEVLLFDSGKATLKPGAKETIAQVARKIKTEFPDRNVFVIGHTDTDPIKYTANQWKDNLDLSQGRGRAVALELLSHGIDPAKVVAGGQGEYSPKAPNDTRANKALNRRVQIMAVARPVEQPTQAPTPGPRG